MPKNDVGIRQEPLVCKGKYSFVVKENALLGRNERQIENQADSKRIPASSDGVLKEKCHLPS
jgi:hypothetical protein